MDGKSPTASPNRLLRPRRCEVSYKQSKHDLEDPSESELSFGGITEGSWYSPSGSEMSSDEFDEKFNKFENFGGYNEDRPVKKIHRSKTSILNPQMALSQPIPLLKNGHTSTKSLPKIITSQTCAFDTYFHLFAACYVDIPPFKNLVDESAEDSSDSLSSLIRSLFDAKETETMNKRNALLRKYYDCDPFMKHITTRQVEIKCNSTLHYVFKQMCREQFFLHSLQECSVCTHCQTTYNKILHHYVKLNYHVLDIKSLGKSLKNSFCNSVGTCDGCSAPLSKEIRLSDIIIIEVDKPNLKEENPYINARIGEIDTEIELRNSIFSLYAVLCFQLVCDIGHFFTLIKRPNSEWQTYDDLSAKVKSTSPNQVFNIAALVYKKAVNATGTILI